MARFRGWMMMVCLAALVAAWAWLPAAAEPQAATSASAPAPATQAIPSPDQAMHDMTNMIEKNPIIEPTQRPAPVRHETTTVNPDVLGSAPGETPANLRREGEFVINRIGHLVRAANSPQVLFVFDADSAASPEPPMILLPCQALQNMEAQVLEHNDRMAIVLSGQITTYRGANYLLTTTWRPATDRGNLLK